MGRRFKIAVAVAAAVVAVAATGCFKSVVAYTRYTMAIYNQTEESGAYSRAREIESYAFYVDTTEWRVASYEDALNRTITNKTTGEQLSVPDVLGEFNSSKEYSMSMVLQQEISMIVVVNPELKLYAYRSYELPVNLESVLTKLYMCSWRRTYTSSGWVVVNQFYVDPRPRMKVREPTRARALMMVRVRMTVRVRVLMAERMKTMAARPHGWQERYDQERHYEA